MSRYFTLVAHDESGYQLAEWHTFEECEICGALVGVKAVDKHQKVCGRRGAKIQQASWLDDILRQMKRESKEVDDGDDANRCQSRIDIDSHEVQCGMGAGHSCRHHANPLHGDGSTLTGRGVVRWGN